MTASVRSSFVSNVDSRLFVIVSWEVSMRRWARAARTLFFTYFFFVVLGMASAPFVVVALVLGNLWVLPAGLLLGVALPLFPVAVSRVYRYRISRLRATLP